MKIIEFVNVSFAIDSRFILESVNWSQDPGRLRFITGPSGSGKTTLLYLLLGLYRPTHGNIFVNGCNLTLLNQKQLSLYRQHIGTVFLQNNLIEHRSVFENIAMPLWIRGQVKKKVNNTVNEMLEKHSLKHLQTLQPRQLSSGDQQRVAIARALITKPHILITDEPTAILDKDTRDFVVSLLRKEARDGRTVIMTTHDERLIDHNTDEVGHLKPEESKSGASTFESVL